MKNNKDLWAGKDLLSYVLIAGGAGLSLVILAIDLMIWILKH